MISIVCVCVNTGFFLQCHKKYLGLSSAQKKQRKRKKKTATGLEASPISTLDRVISNMADIWFEDTKRTDVVLSVDRNFDVDAD